jgi:hypothetical protein
MSKGQICCNFISGLMAVRFNTVVNICHLLSYYFLELLPIFDILNTLALPHFSCKGSLLILHKAISAA